MTRGKESFFWLACVGLSALFLYQIKAILLPFVVGMLTAYFLDPAADWLERKGFTRLSATTLITSSFFSLMILARGLLLPLLARQMIDLLSALPEYAHLLAERYNTVIQWAVDVAHRPDQAENVKGALANVSGMVIGLTGDLLGGVLKSGLAVLNIVALLLITPVVAFYLLRDWDGLIAHMDSLLPRAHADVIRQQFLEVDRTIAGFLHGQLSVMLILAAFYGIALTLAGLQFGLVIGMISGFLVIVPYLGALFGMLVALGMALVQFDSMSRVGVVLAVYIIGQVLEGNVLTPKLVGSKVGLHPVWLIFGLSAGGALFGFLGVLVAVPITAVIGVLIRFALSRYIQSPIYQDVGSRSSCAN